LLAERLGTAQPESIAERFDLAQGLLQIVRRDRGELL